MIAIRQATLVDAKRLLEIYDYYVKNTARLNTIRHLWRNFKAGRSGRDR